MALHIYSQYITNISIAHGTKTKPKAKEKTQKRKTKPFSEKVCDERRFLSKTNITGFRII